MTGLDEMLEYVALDRAACARLVELHTILAADFATIADAFPAPKATPEQAASLHAMVVDWMSTGLLGPYDEPYYASRLALERRYGELGFSPYHLVVAINRIRRAYRARIEAAFPVAAAEFIEAVDKLLDLELAVILHDYQQDSEDRLVTAERKRRDEQVAALQTLCAGLAHEVRNPLNSAKLQLELAERRLRRGGDDPKLVEPIELAGYELDRLTQLLDEFLAFARPYALDPRPQDIVAVVRDVVENDRSFAEQRGAELTLVVDAEPLVADIDAGKVHQIVESLVQNALEAVVPGGRVTIAVGPSNGNVHIRVSDDGGGIPPEILARIYEPFFSTKESGTGMGLSIVHSLVALHHGTIEVDSSPAGTTFDVAVPRGRRTS